MHPNQLHLMGGADEIGASSGLIDLLDTRVVIDAGLRHKRREGSNLPSWAALEARPPDVIVLTHAHLDHSGALPLPLEINPNTHHEALARLVLDLIPKPWRDALIKAPSLHLDRAEVTLRFSLPAVEDWALGEGFADLAERAGFTLSLRRDAAVPRRSVVLASEGTTRAQSAPPEGEGLYTSPAESEPLFH